MSDCFDHLTDAYESFDRTSDEGCLSHGLHLFKTPYDPLYYHVQLNFETLVTKTEKAYLFQLRPGEGVWVPRSICRELRENSVWVHAKTYSKCNKVSVSIRQMR